MKFRIRRTVFLTLRGVVYVLLVFALLNSIGGTGNLFEQFLLVSILLVLSSYLSIDLQYIKGKWIWFFGLFLMCVTSLLTYFKSMQFDIAGGIGAISVVAPLGVMVLLHLGILILFNDKRSIIRNRRKVNGLSFLAPGVSIFAFSIAGMFALLTSAKMSVEKVNCDDFYTAVTDVVRFLGSPLLLGVDAKKKAEQWIDDARTSSVGELIGIDQLNMNDFTTFPSSWDEEESPTIEGIIDMMEEENISNEETAQEAGGLFSFLETYRKRFVTELISDKDMINKGVCTLVIEEVEKKLEKPGFRFSVAILLFFIFSPIINFLFIVVIAVGLVLFHILKAFGVWHTEKVLVEMDVIR